MYYFELRGAWKTLAEEHRAGADAALRSWPSRGIVAGRGTRPLRRPRHTPSPTAANSCRRAPSAAAHHCELPSSWARASKTDARRALSSGSTQRSRPTSPPSPPSKLDFLPTRAQPPPTPRSARAPPVSRKAPPSCDGGRRRSQKRRRAPPAPAVFVVPRLRASSRSPPSTCRRRRRAEPRCRDARRARTATRGRRTRRGSAASTLQERAARPRARPCAAARDGSRDGLRPRGGISAAQRDELRALALRRRRPPSAALAAPERAAAEAAPARRRAGPPPLAAAAPAPDARNTASSSASAPPARAILGASQILRRAIFAQRLTDPGRRPAGREQQREYRVCAAAEAPAAPRRPPRRPRAARARGRGRPVPTTTTTAGGRAAAPALRARPRAASFAATALAAAPLAVELIEPLGRSGTPRGAYDVALPHGSTWSSRQIEWFVGLWWKNLANSSVAAFSGSLASVLAVGRRRPRPRVPHRVCCRRLPTYERMCSPCRRAPTRPAPPPQVGPDPPTQRSPASAPSFPLPRSSGARAASRVCPSSRTPLITPLTEQVPRRAPSPTTSREAALTHGGDLSAHSLAPSRSPPPRTQVKLLPSHADALVAETARAASSEPLLDELMPRPPKPPTPSCPSRRRRTTS